VSTRYILISPVKDEERYVETTIKAVLNQTLLPYRWIIVDDGSRDKTPEIVREYAERFDWIRLVTLNGRSGRQPGSGIIRAFNEGYKLLDGVDFDFIVKFDCDIDFPPEYFEQLVGKFNQDERLGIASGMFFELRRGKWVPIRMPVYHANGQTKVVRTQCFKEIGGFVASRGWDSFDEIKAQMAGWKTGHFNDVYFYHLKREGSGIGFIRTSMMLGEIYYLTGGGILFFLLKLTAGIFTTKPFFLGSLMMAVGYLKALLAGRRRLVSKAEARFYRALLNQRIRDAVLRILGLRTRKRERSIA
jgi:poly-beta-1,6-N-acetyl-D-glucosamine synthase